MRAASKAFQGSYTVSQPSTWADARRAFPQCDAAQGIHELIFEGVLLLVQPVHTNLCDVRMICLVLSSVFDPWRIVFQGRLGYGRPKE